MPKLQEESAPLYEKIIYENDMKFYQLRLVVNEFRDQYYIHIRKYFLSFEGEYIASKEGVSMVAELNNINNLLDGLMEIASLEESKDALAKHFGERISRLESPVQ